MTYGYILLHTPNTPCPKGSMNCAQIHMLYVLLYVCCMCDRYAPCQRWGGGVRFLFLLLSTFLFKKGSCTKLEPTLLSVSSTGYLSHLHSTWVTDMHAHGLFYLSSGESTSVSYSYSKHAFPNELPPQHTVNFKLSYTKMWGSKLHLVHNLVFQFVPYYKLIIWIVKCSVYRLDR